LHTRSSRRRSAISWRAKARAWPATSTNSTNGGRSRPPS